MTKKKEKGIEKGILTFKIDFCQKSQTYSERKILNSGSNPLLLLYPAG